MGKQKPTTTKKIVSRCVERNDHQLNTLMFGSFFIKAATCVQNKYSDSKCFCLSKLLLGDSKGQTLTFLDQLECLLFFSSPYFVTFFLMHFFVKFQSMTYDCLLQLYQLTSFSKNIVKEKKVTLVKDQAFVVILIMLQMASQSICDA